MNSTLAARVRVLRPSIKNSSMPWASIRSGAKRSSSPRQHPRRSREDRPLALLNGPPTITDTASTTLSSATIKIANAGGSAVAGDELYINGLQNGSVGSGVTASWNASTDTLTLIGSATLAIYDTLLSEISYQDTAPIPRAGAIRYARSLGPSTTGPIIIPRRRKSRSIGRRLRKTPTWRMNCGRC